MNYCDITIHKYFFSKGFLTCYFCNERLFFKNKNKIFIKTLIKMNIILSEVFKLYKSSDKLYNKMSDEIILLNFNPKSMNDKLVESKKIVELKNIDNQCCNTDLKTINYVLLCTTCGQIYDYHFMTNSFMFYENLYKVYKKSVYIIKYHILNVINNLYYKRHQNKIQKEVISCNDKIKICFIFEIIKKKLFQSNLYNKRLISVNFI